MTGVPTPFPNKNPSYPILTTFWKSNYTHPIDSNHLQFFHPPRISCLTTQTSETTTNGLLHQIAPSNILFIICISINCLILNPIQILNNSTYIIFPINKFPPVFFQNQTQTFETFKSNLNNYTYILFSRNKLTTTIKIASFGMGCCTPI